MKSCTKCGLSKLEAEFHKDASTKDGFYPSCVDCNKGRKQDKVAKAAYDTRHRKTLGFKKTANKLGVPVEVLENAYAEQKGRCAICGQEEVTYRQTGVRIKLAADHDHKTLEFRGFLCQKHNQGLGMFQDDTNLLEKAIEYLINARARRQKV